jgi:hypothetical protein
VPHDSEDKRLRFHGLRTQVKRYEQSVLVVPVHKLNRPWLFVTSTSKGRKLR